MFLFPITINSSTLSQKSYLLMHSVMSSNSAVGSFSFNGTIRGSKNTGHEAQRSVALSDDIRLDITIVVLASPDEATIRLEHVGDHIVDKSMFVPDTESLEFSLVLLVDFSENILESAVVFLEDSILSRQVQGVLSFKSELEAGMSEKTHRLISIVHSHTNTTSFVLEHIEFLGLSSIVGDEVNLEFTRSVDNEISSFVLITKSMSSDDNGLGPAGNELGDILAKDGFSEDGTVEVVSDGTVGRLPHFLKLEFLDSILIGSNGGAFNTDLAFFDGLGGIESDLIVGFVSILHTEIKVLDVEIKEGSDEVIFDLLPDDSGHLITIKFGDRVSNFDFTRLH